MFASLATLARSQLYRDSRLNRPESVSLASLARQLVVHGAIDGFSSLITYLRCSDNNRASTVLDCFLDGVLNTVCLLEYARIRAERMWTFSNMVDIRGENNHPYLAGSSVHNCRIERLWRDVRSSVLSTYLAVYNTLEGETFWTQIMKRISSVFILLLSSELMRH